MYVNNLNIETHDGRVLIENLSFSLNKGDKAVVIGEEGNGKSTLLKAIYGAKELSSYVKISGTIVANEKIGYLAQELDAGEKTVAEFFDFSSYPFAISPKQLRMISQELSMDENIYYSSTKVKNLSGGEKVKVQLAKLLLGECDLLLLDEPSNDIDIGTLIWLEDFINSIDIPIMFVSHDETLIENTANMIIHIEQLRRKTTP
ncbi:MAG: ATP-binding cassette domain-containing protein, partial [Clostridia bacterium]|nr:ATP-binding cassette domain-containing protein [Clostridia bacterium]